MENAVHENEFESTQEFFYLVANADLSTPEKLKEFKDWQNSDGTKEGLLKIQIKK